MEILETTDAIKPEAPPPILPDAPQPLAPTAPTSAVIPMEATPPIAGHVAPAGFVRRALAFIIDFIFLNFLYLIPATLGVFGLYLSKGEVPDLTSLLAPFVSIWIVLFIGYFTFFHIHSGETPAKRIVRIKVVNKEGKPLSHWAGFLRSLLSLFLLAFFPLGFLVAIFGKKKRALHDFLIGSYVVCSCYSSPLEGEAR